MALHAIRNVGAAFTVTREFLLPFDVRKWLKLAVVVFFLGGGMNLPTGRFDTSGVPGQVPDRVPDQALGQLLARALDSEIPSSVPADVVTAIAVVVAVAVVLAVVVGIVGAIMEFVFVESLRRGEISIRSDWRRRWRQGLRLFGFRIAIAIPVLAAFLGWMALFFVPLFTGGVEPIVSFAVFLGGIPILFVVGLVYGLVSSFTTVFVVPIMIENDSGVLAGWRRLWASIETEWKQYLAYAIVGFVLTLATGLLAPMALGVAGLVLLVPLGIVAGITLLVVSLSSTIGLAVLALLGAVFVATMVLLWALVQVPVLTYLRYYALLVLGDIDTSLDLIPEQRAALRE